MSQSKQKRSNPLRILGVMTGTSCDGLDAACIEITPEGWKPLWAEDANFPATLRKRVLEFQKPASRKNAPDWLKLHRDLGEWYGKILAQMIKKHSEPPDLIANHGQTIAHHPAPRREGITLQLGDPTRIVFHTGITVVSNFREGDMAAGGQGAPLAPLFHKLLSSQLDDPPGGGLSIHNIGGISNLTYISPQGEVLAFDTGPGNIWIDAAAERATGGKSRLDRNGKMAFQGVVDGNAVEKILKHPFFKKLAPKSTGRDDFPFELLLQNTKAEGADLVATATAITVESVALAYEDLMKFRKNPLAKIFVSGGGAKNPTLMAWLRFRLPEIKIEPLSSTGIEGQWIEAQAFAVLGMFSMLGHPLGGAWTGVQGFGPPGHLIPGTNWQQVLIKLNQFLSAF